MASAAAVKVSPPPSFSVASCFKSFIIGCMMISLSSCEDFNICPDPNPLGCRCFTDFQYSIAKSQCPTFIVVKNGVQTSIRCNNNDVNDFSVLNGMHLGYMETLEIFDCSIPPMSLLQLMQNMGAIVANVSYVMLRGIQSELVTRKLFRSLPNLKYVVLGTDRPIQLPDDVFADMSNLEYMTLNSNAIQPKNIFYSLPKLRGLTLISENGTYLDPGVFHKMTRLESLYLNGDIRNLSRGVFSDLRNLRWINIVSNKMNEFPSDLFADLRKLQSVELDYNDLLNLPQHLFTDNIALRTVEVLNNRRTLETLPSRFLANLISLKSVFVDNCKISTLPEDLFWDSHELTQISMTHNSLTTLPNGCSDTAAQK